MLPLVPYSEVLADSARYQHYVNGYRQKPPYNLVTQCYIERNGCRDFNGDGRSWNWGPLNWWPLRDSVFETKATNRAYERFVNKLGDSSSFGATLTAELKETLGMVTGTVLKLVSAARSVKRLDFGSAARTLGLPYKERTIVKRVRGKGRRRKAVYHRRRVFTLPTGREVSKTLANGWLMYSYGVKPLMEDLYNGMDVLQRPWPDEAVKVGASGGSSNTFNDNTPGFYPTSRAWSAKVRVSCGAFVSVENPNLWLLNKMGLINPVQWANEAIPFSFVVDWFSNLSSVIGSLTDFVGLSLRSAWMSKKYDIAESFTMGGPYGYTTEKWRSILSRELKLPQPKLHFAYERVQWQRALNAISLLVGFLPRSR